MRLARRRASAIAAAVIVVAGCRATTGRPQFDPFPEAEHAEIGFGLADKVETVMKVTDTIVAYLQADSIRVARVKQFDGFFETAWLDAATLAPASRAPMGEGVVKIRGYIDPATPGFSKIELETVYVPLADPSLPARELESPVSQTHPVALRVAAVVKKLKDKYGVPEAEPVKPGGTRPPPLRGDTAVVVPDTLKVAPIPVPVPVPAPPPPPKRDSTDRR